MILRERMKRGKMKDMIPRNVNSVREYQKNLRSKVGREKETTLEAKTVNDARVKAMYQNRTKEMLYVFEKSEVAI